MLTPYDEYPVHQSPYPFSYVPATDYNWDDGYYLGAFGPYEKLALYTGFRVNPNSDMIGGYAMLNLNGLHYTVRTSRCWRRQFDMRIGPFGYEVIEPLKKLRMFLEANDSELTYDLIWEGVSPPFLENHHMVVNRSRRTTDQTRYSQPGKVFGTVTFRGRTYTANAETWCGARDHSWGLYAERPPLSPRPKLLPPKQAKKATRAMRFWVCFRTEPYSGFFHWHEDAEGNQLEGEDVFSGRFEGRIYRGFDGAPVILKSVKHQMEFLPGTRCLTRAVLEFADDGNKTWRQHYDVVAPPWVAVTFGYHPGSWKDGGTIHTYHGSEELALEWDEFDWSVQPVRYTPYHSNKMTPEEWDYWGVGYDFTKPLYGVVYLPIVTTTDPRGAVSTGSCHLEHFIRGPYKRYGFT